MIAVCLLVDLAFGLQPYFINNLAIVTVMSILESLYPHCKKRKSNREKARVHQIASGVKKASNLRTKIYFIPFHHYRINDVAVKNKIHHCFINNIHGGVKMIQFHRV